MSTLDDLRRDLIKAQKKLVAHEAKSKDKRQKLEDKIETIKREMFLSINELE